MDDDDDDGDDDDDDDDERRVCSFSNASKSWFPRPQIVDRRGSKFVLFFPRSNVYPIESNVFDVLFVSCGSYPCPRFPVPRPLSPP